MPPLFTRCVRRVLTSEKMEMKDAVSPHAVPLRLGRSMTGVSRPAERLSPRELALVEKAKRYTGIDLTKKPGFGESMIPVWGSGREAMADYLEGDYKGAAMNAALAASDLVPGAVALKGATKAGVKAALKPGTSTSWNAVRERMKRAGAIPPEHQGHHWAIPQGPINVPGLGNVGRFIPDSIRNHPANIKILPDGEHKRIHSRDLQRGLPRYGLVQRTLVGTPTWAKADVAQAATVVGRGVERRADDRRR